MKICLGLCLTSSVLRGYPSNTEDMQRVVALIAGLLTVAFGFARDAVYVEIIAVKAGCNDLAIFLRPIARDRGPSRAPRRSSRTLSRPTTRKSTWEI
jgi:hypothetical protein